MPEFQQAAKAEPNSAWVGAELAHAHAVSGRRNEASQALKDLQERSRRSYVANYNFVLIYTGLGDHQQALTFLEKAYEDRSVFMTFLPADPELDPLRSEPRFKELLRKLGL